MNNSDDSEFIDSRTQAILTEHFGFSPLDLVHEVINSVNQIMYNCTEEVERHLLNTFPQTQHQAIKEGVSQLENNLESEIDANFDKYELYVLRNIMNIPKDLIDQGWLKLKHHQGIEFNEMNVMKKLEFDDEINKILRQISNEIQIRKVLKSQIKKGAKVMKILNGIEANLKFLNSNNENEVMSMLGPMDEVLYFVIKEIQILIETIEKLSLKLGREIIDKQIFKPSLRDRFINQRTLKILQRKGIVKQG